MLIAATAIFLYYTVWTLFMVCLPPEFLPDYYVLSVQTIESLSNNIQPFVDEDHPLHSLFPPRVWAIRIPVIHIILFTTVVGSFLSVVMIRSNRKKALKAQQKKAS
jgi:dolichyl-phosphate mannosyltransferase polypeptide 2 regulatory subunit